MDTIRAILRELINDSGSLTYADASLNKVIVAAAYMLLNEFTFENTYVVSISGVTITPDPDEDAFIVMTALKSACMIGGNELKVAAANSFKVVDGPAQIDTTGHYRSLESWHKGCLQQYSNARLDFMVNGAGAFRTAVTTPITEETVYTTRFH